MSNRWPDPVHTKKLTILLQELNSMRANPKDNLLHQSICVRIPAVYVNHYAG